MVTTVHTAITSAVIRPTAVAVAQVVVVMTVGVAVGHLMTHAVGGVGSRSSRMVAVLVAVGIAQAGVGGGFGGFWGWYGRCETASGPKNKINVIKVSTTN